MGRGTIELAIFNMQETDPAPDGWHWRKVTGKPGGKPVVDLTGADVLAAVGMEGDVTVTWSPWKIIVRKSKD
jgi:hypothetical protein